VDEIATQKMHILVEWHGRDWKVNNFPNTRKPSQREKFSWSELLLQEGRRGSRECKKTFSNTDRTISDFSALEEAAEDFIHNMDGADMKLLTELGTDTWRRKNQKSTINLTLVSRNLTECTVAEDLENRSDHLPIWTVIDINTVAAEQSKQRNFQLMDHKELLGFVVVCDGSGFTDDPSTGYYR
jgi:hypothetical protein